MNSVYAAGGVRHIERDDSNLVHVACYIGCALLDERLRRYEMLLWQKRLSLGSALVCASLVGCEQSPHAASAVDANPTKAREHVIGCYKDAYQAKEGTSPVVNNNERTAAEQLLSRYNGESSRACEAINEAMAHKVCDMPVSLVSIVQCDQRQREAKAGQGVDNNTKAQLSDRIKENSRRDMTPNGSSGN